MSEKSALKASSTLFVVRHGRTDWNAKKKIQGLIDRPLDEMGRKQAQELAERFSGSPIAAIYSSPLIRAKETAEWIKKHHHCPLILDEDLREGACGPIEGMSWEEYYSAYAEKLKERSRFSIAEKLAYKIVPECESGLEISKRVVQSLKRICSAHPAEAAVVVTHGFVIRALLSWLGNHDDEGIEVSNTGLLRMEGDGEALSIVGHEGIQMRGAT